MKNVLVHLSIAALCCMTVSAVAAPDPMPAPMSQPGVSSRAKPVKLTTGQALQLLAALENGLSVYQKGVDKDGKATTARYAFDADVVWAMSRNIVVLKWVQQTYDKARDRKMTEIGDGKVLKPGSDEELKFFLAQKEMLAHEEALNLYTFTRDELKMKEQPIDQSILAALAPIMPPDE